MKHIKKIEVLGDSILKGIQVNPKNQRYCIKNDIDVRMLSAKYDLTISNKSRFGCNVVKGSEIITKNLENGLECDALVMDFGGNDCDYKWADIADNPNGKFEPNIPLEVFKSEYVKLIRHLKNMNIIPILTTLPPLEPQRFFDWWCRNLNKENVLNWLGSIGNIYKHQESYSECVKEIAKTENVPLVDLRAAFLQNGNIENLMCIDGTHPNSKGQSIITKAFQKYIHDNGLLVN